MSTTYQQLLSACEVLTNAQAWHPDGFWYWPQESFDKELGNEHRDCGTCTNGARLIAQQFSGRVVGYPISTLCINKIAHEHGGHDFAIVDNQLLVDWWAYEYEESLLTPILHLDYDSDIIAVKYLPLTDWQSFKHLDFRNK